MAFSMVARVSAALLFALLATATPPTEAGADEKTCLPSVVSLMPCLPYVNNKSPAPSGACCENLARVVRDHPLCLCAVLDGEAGQWLHVPVDVNKALALPAACKVQTPPTSKCHASSESTPPSPAPSTGDSGADSLANITKSNYFLILSLLFVGLYLIGF